MTSIASVDFLEKQKEKYKIRDDSNQRKILKGINAKAIKSDSEMSDLLNLARRRRDRINKGHHIWDVVQQENIISEANASNDDDDGVSIGAKSTKSNSSRHTIEKNGSGKVNAGANVRNIAMNLLTNVTDANNLSLKVNFDNVSTLYFGMTVLIMNCSGEVLVVNSNKELRCKPQHLLLPTDKARFKLVDVRHVNKSGPVHYGEHVWIQILDDAEGADNSFKSGTVLSAMVKTLPLHETVNMSAAGKPILRENNKPLKKLEEDEEDNSLSENTKFSGKNTNKDVCGNIDLIRIADTRKLEKETHSSLDFQEADEVGVSKSKRSYISRQANHIGRWCIECAIRPENLTAEQKASMVTKASENHTDMRLVTSLMPVVIQQDFYCLGTQPAKEYTNFSNVSDDIVENTNIFTKDELLDFEEWRKTDADYILLKAKKVNAQKSRGKVRILKKMVEDDGDDGSNRNIKKSPQRSMKTMEEINNEKQDEVEFGCVRKVVQRRFPYEFAVDRKCVWKFVLFEQFASKAGEEQETEQDKVTFKVMETAKMVLKLSKLNREGGRTYLPAREAQNGLSPNRSIGSWESSQGDNNSGIDSSIAGIPHGSTANSMLSRQSKMSALPPLKSGDSFCKTIRYITRTNLTDIQEKYTEICRENELKIKSYFEGKLNRFIAVEDATKSGPIGGSTRVRKFKTNNRSRRGTTAITSSASLRSSSSAASLTSVNLEAVAAATTTMTTKPSLLLVDDDQFSDIAGASDVSPLGMSVASLSNRQLSVGGYDSARSLENKSMNSASGSKLLDARSYADGHSLALSAASSSSVWTPSDSAKEIFNLTDHRLTVDKLLLTNERVMQHFDKFSEGEKLLAMHTTFHNVIRDTEQQQLVQQQQQMLAAHLSAAAAASNTRRRAGSRGGPISPTRSSGGGGSGGGRSAAGGWYDTSQLPHGGGEGSDQIRGSGRSGGSALSPLHSRSSSMDSESLSSMMMDPYSTKKVLGIPQSIQAKIDMMKQVEVEVDSALACRERMDEERKKIAKAMTLTTD